MGNVNEALQSTVSAFRGVTLRSLLTALITLLVCLIARRALVGLLRRALSHTRLEPKLQGLIVKLVGIVLWIVVILMITDQLGVNITSLVALFSVAGLALSLAIQDSLSNLAGGITILSSRPFRVGDFVEAGGQSGTVKAIGMVYTQLTTLDNKVVYLPNSAVAASTIVNYSAQETRRIEITVSASYDDPTDKVKSALLSAASGDPRVLSDPAPFAALTEYGDSAIKYVLRVWVPSKDFYPAQVALTEAVRDAFQREGITMTYNHLNVHVEDK